MRNLTPTRIGHAGLCRFLRIIWKVHEFLVTLGYVLAGNSIGRRHARGLASIGSHTPHKGFASEFGQLIGFAANRPTR